MMTIEFKNPFLCPNCGKENARWNSERELVVCPDCSQEIDLDEHALAAALAEEGLALEPDDAIREERQ